MIEEGIAVPVLLGNRRKIGEKIEELQLGLNGVTIIDPDDSPDTERYAQVLFELRQRKGVTLSEARLLIRRGSGTYYGSVMVRLGDADALLSGIDAHYPDIIRPALEVIGKRAGLSSVHGLYMMVFKRGIFFLADATVCIDPTSEELAETAILAAEMARVLEIEPHIAMLSFSNFGSVKHPHALKVKRAVEMVKERAPQLIVDGEMQSDTAVTPELLAANYPFSTLKGAANVLIFPDLTSGNICYKLLNRLGGAEAIGPILMGMKKPIHVLQRGDDVANIVNMAAIAVVDAQKNVWDHFR